jgi:two-component system cell cycle sensor histidine kinase/response regulator CckA
MTTKDRTSSQGRRKLRVLFAEDSPMDMQLIASVLQHCGYDLAYDSVDAPGLIQDQLQQADYQLIISDYNLQGGTAIDVLEAIKKSGKDLPCVVVTGCLGDEAAAECIRRGASDYLLKDRLARLPSAIEHALEEKVLQEERRRSAEALRLSEANYRSLVEGAPYGIYRASLDGKLLSANLALVEMLGYDSVEKMLGLNLKTDIYVNPAEGERALQQDAGVQGPRGVEETWKGKDGKTITVRRSGRPILDEQGKVLYVEAIAEDVTDRKLLEEQLRQAQKMEAIGQLAGGLANDFKNLLGVILDQSDMVLENLNPPDPLHGKLEKIKKAAQRAASVTRQLLAFSHKQVLETRVLDLNWIVKDMENMLRHLIGEEIELAIAPGAGQGWVKADPRQIEQLLVNLAMNARNAMPWGGKITIETANVELDETYARDEHVAVQPGSYVMLAVSDTGLGMDSAVQTRILEPFFTTKPSRKGNGKGTGLATVFGIVKESAGDIWLYSEPGRGTSFRVYLPRVEAAAQPDDVRIIADADARGRETILLVEDEESLRNLAQEFLEVRGYTVVEAGNGAEALEIAERCQEPIHLMLTDVVMPGIGGRDLVQHLERLHPEMKVLYVSGRTNDLIVQRGVRDPRMAFLQKPFVPGELARKVREVLDAPKHAR